MKNTILSICILLPLLIGCSGFAKKENSMAVVTPETIFVDSRLLQPCQPLPKIPQQADFDSIAQHYVSTIGLYGECSLKQDASISAINKFSNQDK